MNKLTLKDNTISHCFTLFIFGGPCHLSSFRQCYGNIIFPQKSFFYALMEKMNVPEFVLLHY